MAEVRAATPDDACEVASIHVRAWQVAYRGLLPQEYLDALRPEDRARGYTFGHTGAEHPAALVAVEHGMICGFVITGPSHDSDLQDARELWAIYVDPQRWGNGIGRSSWRLPEIGFIKTVRARPCFGSSQETLAPGASTARRMELRRVSAYGSNRGCDWRRAALSAPPLEPQVDRQR